ncbi:hypothetical protein Tco_1344145 [Tanacetum coccineum]
MLVHDQTGQGEGSTVLVESQHTPITAPSTSQPQTSAPLSEPQITQPPISLTTRETNRQETKVPQPGSSTPSNVADEAAFIGVDVNYGGAATIVTGLDAGQGSGNIYKTPTMPHDLPLPGGHTPRSVEGSLEQNELMELCTKLSKRVTDLENDLKKTKETYSRAYTTLIKKVTELEKKVKKSKPTKKEDCSLFFLMKKKIWFQRILPNKGGITPTQVSAQGEAHSQEDQPEDQLGVLNAAKVLADAAIENVQIYTRRRMALSTGSGGLSTASRLFSTAEESVSTAGASMPVSTAGMVQEVNISIPSPVAVKDKGKGKMEESEDEQTKRTKLQQEQDRLGHEAAVRLQEELDEEERHKMARVHEAAQSFTKEEWENIRARVEADEELTQRLQAEERNKYSEVDQAKMLVDLINQRKRYFSAQKDEAKRNKPMTQAQ